MVEAVVISAGFEKYFFLLLLLFSLPPHAQKQTKTNKQTKTKRNKTKHTCSVFEYVLAFVWWCACVLCVASVGINLEKKKQTVQNNQGNGIDTKKNPLTKLDFSTLPLWGYPNYVFQILRRLYCVLCGVCVFVCVCGRYS